MFGYTKLCIFLCIVFLYLLTIFFLFLRIFKDIPSQPLLIDIMFMLKYSRTNRIVISIVFLNLLELFI